MPDFDLSGARKAGVSYGDIADFMAPKVGYDVEAARKAGVSNRDIALEVTKSSPVSDDRINPSDVRAEAMRFGVDPDFATALITQESGGNDRTRDSPKGAAGIAQVMPATFKAVMPEGNIRDPWHNLEAGLRYLKQGAQQLGIDPQNLDPKSARLLAAGYHQGFNGPELAQGRISNTTDGLITTPKYADTIASRYETMKASRPAQAGDTGGGGGEVPMVPVTQTPSAPAKFVSYDDYTKQILATPEGKKLDQSDIADQWIAKYGDMNPPSTKRSLGEAITDFATSVASGVGNMFEGFGTLYGLASQDMDNGLRQLGQTTSDYWDSKKSAGLLESERLRKEKIDAAESDPAKFATAIGQTIINPALMTTMVGKNLAMLFPAGAAGRIGGIVSKVVGASGKVAEGVATGATIGMGAIQQGADVASDTYKAAMTMPQDQWEKNEAYRVLRVSIGDDKAKKSMSRDMSLQAGTYAALLSAGVNSLPGMQQVERLIAGAATRSGKGLIRGAAAGTLKEAGTESIEEGGGQALSNQALQTVDPTRPIMKDVAETAGLAAVGGGPFGAVAGGVSGLAPEKKTAAPAPVAAPPTTQKAVADVFKAPDVDSTVAAAIAGAAAPIAPKAEPIPAVPDITAGPAPAPFDPKSTALDGIIHAYRSLGGATAVLPGTPHAQALDAALLKAMQSGATEDEIVATIDAARRGGPSPTPPVPDIPAPPARMPATPEVPTPLPVITTGPDTHEAMLARIKQRAEVETAYQQKAALDTASGKAEVQAMPTATENALREALAAKARKDALTAESERQKAAKAQRDAETARIEAEKQAKLPQPGDLPILDKLNRRQPLSDIERAVVVDKGYGAIKEDGTLKMLGAGFRARAALLRAQKQPTAAPRQSEQAAAPTPAPTPAKPEPATPEWQRFPPESGTLGVPRNLMPQIKSEHRGAMTNFLNARGITHTQEEIQADSLKATQAEFSPAKVAQARAYEGGDRAVLISSDGHILDGHHQALAKGGETIRAIRLNAPIRELLPVVSEFPSAGAAGEQKAAPEKIGGTLVADMKPNVLRVHAKSKNIRNSTLAKAEIERREAVTKQEAQPADSGKVDKAQSESAAPAPQATPKVDKEPTAAAPDQIAPELAPPKPASEAVPDSAVTTDHVAQVQRETAEALKAAAQSMQETAAAMRDIAAQQQKPGPVKVEPATPEPVKEQSQPKATPSDQTDTPAFSKWFGDSKVVDAEGRPLVVYHGTTADVTAFDAARAGSNTRHPTSRLGFWFTSSPDVASLFTQQVDDSTWPPKMIDRSGANVMPAYLAINNPFVMSVETFREINGRPFGEEVEREQPEAVAKFRSWLDANKANIIAKGHDGIKVEGNTRYDNVMGGEEYAADAWVAFKPEQIKSATGNNGQFDTNNPDITFSRQDRITSSMKREEVSAIAKIFQSKFKGVPAIHAAQSVKEAPEGLRKEIREAGAENDVGGAWYNGEIYLFADNLRDADHAKFVVLHEATHNGLRGMFGREMDPVMMSIYMSNETVRNAAKEQKRKFPYLTTMGATEEALANMGADGVPQSVWQRLVAGVRNILRKLGLTLELNDNDIKSIVGRALAFNKTPSKSTDIVRGTAFSATTAEDVDAVPATAEPVGNRATWDAPEPTRLDSVLHALQDKHIDTKRVLQAIKKNSKELAESLDVYLQEELFHGRTAKNVEDFLAKELNPLVARMSANGIKTKADIQAFEQYLHNRHAKERNEQIAKINLKMPDGGSGITTAAARDYLAALEPGLKKRYEGLAKVVDAMNVKTRQLLVDYGLESQSTIDAWNATYKSYVPLQREDVGNSPGIGQGFSVKGSATKRATGSARNVVDILANIAMQRETAIVRGEKNRVANALVGLATANPNPEFWVVDEPPKIKYVDPRTGFVAEAVDPLYKSRENVVTSRTPNAKGDIDEHAVIFNEGNERALRMAKALKNLDADQLGEVLGHVAKFTRFFAAVNTQFNPIFGVVNLTRDTQGAILNLSTTPIADKKAEVLKHTLSALKGIYIDLRDTRAGKEPTSEWAQLFEEFQKEGGQTGFRDMFRTSKDRTDAIAKELSKGGENAMMQVWHAAKGWLSDYNLAMENAVRLASYKVAKDSGMSDQQSASLAKNLTVNFNRKGQATTQIGALYAFFNASVQGTARLTEVLRGPAGKKIIIGGISLGVIQALALAAAGFDDDEPPGFVRERNLIIPIGDKKYLTVPMPLGLHLLPNLGRIPAELVLSGFKNPAKRIGSLFNVLADAFNPVGNAGMSLQTITPTIIDPLAALSENKDWTGKSIARQDFGLNVTPGYTRAKDTASKFSKLVSEGINYLTGGTAYKPGAFSPTPDQIDYLAGQISGGVGREVLKAEQTSMSAITGEDMPAYKIPLAGRFYGNADDPSTQSSRFYDNVKAMNEHEAEIKGRRKHGENVSEYLNENPEARLYAQANHVERDVAKLRTRKRELLERDASPETIRMIDKLLTARMQRFNETVKRLSE